MANFNYNEIHLGGTADRETAAPNNGNGQGSVSIHNLRQQKE